MSYNSERLCASLQFANNTASICHPFSTDDVQETPFISKSSYLNA